MGYRIKKIVRKDDMNFIGYYKGHEICIDREEDDDYKFYIVVRSPEGTFCYDGWWSCYDKYPTIDDAIEEALRGSLLIAPTQQKGGE